MNRRAFLRLTESRVGILISTIPSEVADRGLHSGRGASAPIARLVECFPATLTRFPFHLSPQGIQKSLPFPQQSGPASFPTR